MYLEHFGLKEVPFSLSPNTQYFCHLTGHQEALNVLLFGLRSGESLIKVTGEVGSGKTLLCRKLMNSLDSHFVLAYIPNPDLSPAGIRMSLARELGVEITEGLADHFVLELVTEQLIKLRQQGKHVVLLIDEAQALSDESLEAIRLITNIETESQKLLQIVLFAQPELDVRLNSYHFRQLKQRITFACNIDAIKPGEIESYLSHRLMIAGHTRAGQLFTRKATKILYEYSRGIPRVINMVSHKAMLVAYGRGNVMVDHHAIKLAVKDNQLITSPSASRQHPGAFLAFSLSGMLIVLFFIYVYFNQLTQ
ncbi:MAG: ExeA family protein [Gammaproteobacteria bacterium]